MSVRVTAWKGTQRGYEIDIRIAWPEGGRYRERVKSPVSGESAALRWGLRREMEVLRLGREGASGAAPIVVTPSAAPPATPRESSAVPTLAEFAPRFVEDYAIARTGARRRGRRCS